MKLLPRTSINTDDNLGRGMDLALVTLVFLGLGYALDRIFDTQPVFMITLFILSMIGQFIKMWFAYDGKMKLLEAERAQITQAHRA